jgi:hypothetical protein
MNRWNIPDWLEREVIARDTRCVYCSTPFASREGPRRSRASWEHIIKDARIVTRANIALCCIGCNASKGAKTLEAWLSSKYCRLRSISASTVAVVVREALSSGSMNHK